MPTLFERIIAGEIPASFVYRDARVVAFRDIHPRAPTHILIVPVKPIATLDDASAEDEAVLGHLLVVATQIARSEGIAAAGYRVIVNCREHGGQEVYHLHLHLLGGKPLGPMVSA
ncbi:MAG TPA: histidine triad nucleotide-binding protein [Steroidobacteraceae bacterium]|nr:histidine triad nucleotide-binding protein [Steroidobacteraceae bacterium]